jgi:hypothetical protein
MASFVVSDENRPDEPTVTGACDPPPADRSSFGQGRRLRPRSTNVVHVRGQPWIRLASLAKALMPSKIGLDSRHFSTVGGDKVQLPTPPLHTVDPLAEQNFFTPLPICKPDGSVVNKSL